MQNHISKQKLSTHEGHSLTITSDPKLVCVACGVTLYDHVEQMRIGNKSTKAWYANMAKNDPERYKEINKLKSRKRRARIKEQQLLTVNQEG